LVWVLALSEIAPLAPLVSTVPVAEPVAEPVAVPLVSTVPVAVPSAFPMAVPLVSTVPVVVAVSVETRPVSGPVFTFAWFLEHAASEATAAKASNKRIEPPVLE